MARQSAIDVSLGMTFLLAMFRRCWKCSQARGVGHGKAVCNLCNFRDGIVNGALPKMLEI